MLMGCLVEATYQKMPNATRRLARGPAREIHSSSTGRSRRSRRERPPIGNITISRVRILNHDPTAAWATSCSRTLANNPRIKVAKTAVDSYPNAVTTRNNRRRTNVKCNLTGTPNSRNALTVPAVAPRSTGMGRLFTGHSLQINDNRALRQLRSAKLRIMQREKLLSTPVLPGAPATGIGGWHPGFCGWAKDRRHRWNHSAEAG